jgi:GAF domain-containing protein
LLTRILHLACDLIGADHGAIGLLDEQENVMRTEVIYNMPADELGAVMPPGVGIAGTMLLRHEPMVLDRYGNVDRPARTDSLDNPVIGMPIVWQGRVIGFFCIGVHAEQAAREGREIHHFVRSDLDALAVFARHAAIAIENARRYQRERLRTQRLAIAIENARLYQRGQQLAVLEERQRLARDLHDSVTQHIFGITLIAQNTGFGLAS